MALKVLHLVRKNTQLKASFIQNQIINHIDFEPFVAYYENRDSLIDGGFANNLPERISVFSVAKDNSFFSRFFYKIFKKIGQKSSKELRRFIVDTNPDIIHLHYATDAGIFLPVIKDFKIPKVVSVYGYETSGFPRRFMGYGKTFLKTKTYKYADLIFAMSPDMKKDLISTECPESKIEVHYYGTDVQMFNYKHSYQETKIVKFLIISGLTPQKGHLFLLNAFKLAWQDEKNIRLTIVGDGPEKEKILQFIEQNGMKEYVSLKPFVVYGSREHKEYFATSDVFIHPSLTDINGDKEGIPGAIIEAMSAGLPVISTYHAGIPYIIEHEKSGLLVKEWDIDGLKNQIIKMVGNHDLRKFLGMNGQIFAQQNLDLFEKEKQLEKIYKKLIHNLNDKS